MFFSYLVSTSHLDSSFKAKFSFKLLSRILFQITIFKSLHCSFISEQCFVVTLCLVSYTAQAEAGVVLCQCGPGGGEPRRMAGRGKAKKSGELHSHPGKVVTARGEGNIRYILEDQGKNKSSVMLYKIQIGSDLKRLNKIIIVLLW